MHSTTRRQNRLARSQPAASPAGETVHTSGGRTLRVDPAPSGRAGISRRQKDIAKLKQIRGSLDELILLAEAQDHLPRTATGHIPTKGAVKFEIRQLLSQLRDMIGGRTPDHTASHSKKASPSRSVTDADRVKRRIRVQLRLSRALVRILTAFGKSGHNPGYLTERSLWNDPAVRDAAAILGIAPPLKKTTRSGN